MFGNVRVKPNFWAVKGCARARDNIRKYTIMYDSVRKYTGMAQLLSRQGRWELLRFNLSDMLLNVMVQTLGNVGKMIGNDRAWGSGSVRKCTLMYVLYDNIRLSRMVNVVKCWGFVVGGVFCNVRQCILMSGKWWYLMGFKCGQMWDYQPGKNKVRKKRRGKYGLLLLWLQRFAPPHPGKKGGLT